MDDVIAKGSRGAADTDEREASRLEGLGYEQQLKREFGFWHAAATGFADISPIVAMGGRGRVRASCLRWGRREPVRYLAPMWSTSKSTMEAIAAYGIRYDSSMFDDDRPYLLDTPTRRLAELPIHWCLDDWEQHIYVPDPDFGHIINRPSIVAQLWTEEFDAIRDTGSLAVLTCHPFCSGRPSRLRAIETFIDFAESCGEVSFRRADKLPEALLATPATALSVERIE